MKTAPWSRIGISSNQVRNIANEIQELRFRLDKRPNHSGFIFRDETPIEPLIFERPQVEKLERLTQRLVNSLVRVAEIVFRSERNGPEALPIVNQFFLSQYSSKEIIERVFGRADFLISKNEIYFLEFNSRNPGGIINSASLSPDYLRLWQPYWRARGRLVSTIDVSLKYVRALKKMAGAQPSFSEYDLENELYSPSCFFAAAGVPTRYLVSPRRREVKPWEGEISQKLFDESFIDLQLDKPFLEWAARNSKKGPRIIMNWRPLQDEIDLGAKVLFAALHENLRLFSPSDQRFISNHIPFSAAFYPSTWTLEKKSIETKRLNKLISRIGSKNLVLKRDGFGGGQGVFPGSQLSKAAFENAVHESIKSGGRFILQEWREPDVYKIIHWSRSRSQTVTREVRAVAGSYWFSGDFGGALFRAQPISESGPINATTGAMFVPMFIAD